MKRLVVILVVVAMVLAVVGIAVLALLVADEDSPGADNPPVAVTPTPEPGASDSPDPALAQFYAQELTWEECRGPFYCATVTVPLDYAEPDGETIDLALLKAPASDPDRRIGSLLVNPGGPGAPGTEYAAQSDLVFRDPLLQQFDIVGFDPRGTGSSSPVDCLTDEELDAYIAGDPDPDTAEERRATVGLVQAFGAGCAELSGDLAAHVSTIEAARDMDVIRATLGEAKLTYFGASYGTKLGATYAELFSEQVGRFVLDGAVDLSIPSRQLSLEQAEGFETALRAYVENCIETTESCFLGEDVDAGVARIAEFIEDVDAQALPTSGDRSLEVGNAFYGIVAPLYNRDYWFVLSAALQAGFDGDGTALLELSDLYSSRGADGYDDNSAEAIYAINCLDDPYAITPDEVPSAIPEFEQVSPTFGEVFAWGLIGCSGVQVESSEKPLTLDGSGAAPIVVIGTTRDPATPYRWAESLAEQLESGVLVSRDGDGHTGYNAGNECVDEAVEAYLVAGTVPDDGLSC
ncbi:MAG: alpha/beta hydrolase [Nocardioides sp.]